jgi:hypothetical protein
MSIRTLTQINMGSVRILPHLKTNRLPDRDDNNTHKGVLADRIAYKCREKNWNTTVHRWPKSGYCSELDGVWAFPISIVDGKLTYTYMIFSLSDLDGNYGSPFYNYEYTAPRGRGGIDHHDISKWSKFDEFEKIVKEVFDDFTEIKEFITTK